MSYLGAGGDSLKLSAVIPAYNEQECVEACLDEVAGVLEELGLSYEIIVVDDGSTDRTLEILKARKTQMPQLVIVVLDANCGQSAAFDAGFRTARGEWIVTLDADLQNDPADIPKLLALADRYDVVCGARAQRRDSLVRRISSRTANLVRNWLTHESIRDVGCSLRLIRASYARELKMFKGMHRFLPTLLRYGGATIAEVPVNHRPRRAGRGKYGITNRLFVGLRDLFAVRWMCARWLDYKTREVIR